MISLFDEKQIDHEPGFFLSKGSRLPNPEVAERGKVLKESLIKYGHELKSPESHGMRPIASVHSSDYLHFLKNIFRRWQQIQGAYEEVIPNVHPNRRSRGYPDSVVGQAGWIMADTECPTGS